MLLNAIRPVDLLDIAIVSYIIYKFFLLIKGSRAWQLVKGMSILVIVTFVARLIHLETISWILERFWTIGIVAVVILFQPEIRQALARIGQRPLWRRLFYEESFVQNIVNVVFDLSKKKYGALIVIERTTGMENYIESGVKIDGEFSAELINSIFNPSGPLHDGAIVLRNKRVVAASCILPLSENVHLSRVYGTRHRAALGLSEKSDALIMVVSEETGNVSLIMSGRISTDLDRGLLKEMLYLHAT